MSENISQCSSLITALSALQINNNNNYGTHRPEESNSAQNLLTCRMPQTTAGDSANSDDTDTDTDSDDVDVDSDVIVVVDSSDQLSEVSYIRPQELCSTSISDTHSELEPDTWDWLTESETIPETDSDLDMESDAEPELQRRIHSARESKCSTNGSSRQLNNMDSSVSTPNKRKHVSYAKRRNSQSGSRSTPDTDSPPTLRSRVITTRSGRAVRARIDHKFDYSSERQDVDDSDDLDDTNKSDDPNDPDFSDNELNKEIDNMLDDDDDMEDEDYKQREYCEPTRKHRRLSIRSSCCSSSDASFIQERVAYIYLDLKQTVAIASSEPTIDDAVEFDSELKIRLQKFLGLVAPKRRLYNPMDDLHPEDNHMDANDSLSLSSRLCANNSNTQPTPKVSAPTLPSPTASRHKILDSDITNEMKMLLLNDIIQHVNANYFESQTPAHIKEPIDLSGLPSAKQRALNCQQHKKILNLLTPCSGSYSFLDSLKSDTPLNMCHPLAENFRKPDFENYKGSLAKTLFNMLNHKIFHCGLRFSITWKSCMNTPSSIVHWIEASGQRMSRIVLWEHIKHPGVLVKALLHEMCHAAAFVYHGETGHGDNCRKWAYRAKSLLPELPQIDDCKAGYKYTCLLCHDSSFGIIKFEDEEQLLRCHYCQFEVNVEQNRADDVHNLSLCDQLVTPYKEFVRANYLQCAQSGHSAKMREINVQFKEKQHRSLSNT